MKRKLTFLLSLTMLLGLAHAQNHSLKFTKTSKANVTITNGPVLGQNFTVEAFFVSDSNVSANMIFGQDSITTGTVYRRSPFVTINNYKCVTYGFDYGTTTPTHLSKKVFASNNKLWNHLALTYDGSVLSLYMNGRLVDTMKRTITVSPIRLKYIGGQLRGTTDEYFNGSIDEVRVWNSVKTPTEIFANANTDVLTGTENNLQMLYTFNDTLVDLTGKTTATRANATYVANKYSATTFPALTWNGNGTTGTLNVAVTSAQSFSNPGPTTKYDSVSVFSVFITDINNKPIKTIVHYGANHAYELWFYEKYFGGYAPDVISGASQMAHNKPAYSISYNLQWDGKDMFGNLVDDGQYFVHIDMNDHTSYTAPKTKYGDHDTISFVKGTNPVLKTPANDTAFTNITVSWTPNSTTGIKTAEFNKDVNVYPNPANNEINVAINEDIVGKLIVRIFDIKGQLVASNNINKGENTTIITFNTEKFPAGLYSVQVLNNAKIINKQIVITK